MVVSQTVVGFGVVFKLIDKIDFSLLVPTTTANVEILLHLLEVRWNSKDLDSPIIQVDFHYLVQVNYRKLDFYLHKKLVAILVTIQITLEEVILNWAPHDKIKMKV